MEMNEIGEFLRGRKGSLSTNEFSFPIVFKEKSFNLRAKIVGSSQTLSGVKLNFDDILVALNMSFSTFIKEKRFRDVILEYAEYKGAKNLSDVIVKKGDSRWVTLPFGFMILGMEDPVILIKIGALYMDSTKHLSPAEQMGELFGKGVRIVPVD